MKLTKETIKQQFRDDDPVFDEGFDAAWGAMADEVRAVLQQLDHLSEVLGDEGVFRRCRDRLRALVDGEIYVVWRDDYRHYRDKFIVSKFNDYLEEASLMVDEYGMFENGEEV